MARFVTAGAGFLLAVLWFDLMHDVQALGRSGAELPESALASITGYYRRVTTEARPMNRLVAAAMLATVAAIGAQLSRGGAPRWLGWTALLLAVSAIALAVSHTVPSAVRLGARGGTAAEQSRLARAVARDHLACFVAMATVLVAELAAGG
jgi:hypothetical protein